MNKAHLARNQKSRLYYWVWWENHRSLPRDHSSQQESEVRPGLCRSIRSKEHVDRNRSNGSDWISNIRWWRAGKSFAYGWSIEAWCSGFLIYPQTHHSYLISIKLTIIPSPCTTLMYPMPFTFTMPTAHFPHSFIPTFLLATTPNPFFFSRSFHSSHYYLTFHTSHILFLSSPRIVWSINSILHPSRAFVKPIIHLSFTCMESVVHGHPCHLSTSSIPITSSSPFSLVYPWRSSIGPTRLNPFCRHS